MKKRVEKTGEATRHAAQRKIAIGFVGKTSKANGGGISMKKYMLLLILFLSSLLSLTAYADGMFGDGGWQHHMIGGGWFMWFLWILVIGVVVYFFVDYSRKQTSTHKETPLDILQKRYAKGEITKEEYEHMKQNLQH